MCSMIRHFSQIYIFNVSHRLLPQRTKIYFSVSVVMFVAVPVVAVVYSRNY